MTYLSPSHERILGHPLSFWETGHGPSIVHPDDIEELPRDADARCARRPGMWARVRCRHRHANGSWRWFEHVFTNMFHVPEVQGVVSNSRDTTDAEAALDALRRTSERFRALVRHSSDVIIVVDATGSPSYVSPALEHVLGYRPDDLVGRDPARAGAPRGSPDVRRTLQHGRRRPDARARDRGPRPPRRRALALVRAAHREPAARAGGAGRRGARPRHHGAPRRPNRHSNTVRCTTRSPACRTARWWSTA